jgi:hypothetical protein
MRTVSGRTCAPLALSLQVLITFAAVPLENAHALRAGLLR